MYVLTIVHCLYLSVQTLLEQTGGGKEMSKPAAERQETRSEHLVHLVNNYQHTN